LPTCLAITNGEENIALHLLRYGTDLSLLPVQASSKSSGHFGGAEVIDAILGSAFKSERLILALLDQGIFSSDYIEASLRCPAGLVETLWGLSAQQGYDKAARELVTLGVSVDHLMKGTKNMHCVMSMGRRVRACTRLSKAAKALFTRDHVRGISGLSAPSNTINSPLIVG
jgi:hypothetical protein